MSDGIVVEVVVVVVVEVEVEVVVEVEVEVGGIEVVEVVVEVVGVSFTTSPQPVGKPPAAIKARITNDPASKPITYLFILCLLKDLPSYSTTITSQLKCQCLPLIDL